MNSHRRAETANERVTSPFRERGTSPAQATSPEAAALGSSAVGGAVVATAATPSSNLSSASVPTLRPMTGFEEEYLEAAVGQANTARLCNGLLARCAVAPGEDAAEALVAVRALGVAQRDRALVELRRRSLGDQVATEVDCPSCGETNEVDFDLSALPLEIQAVAEPLEVTLGAERRGTLRLPTAGDQEALLDAPKGSPAEGRSRLLARLLLSLGSEKGPFSEQRVHALPTADRRALEAAVDEATPDLSLDMAVRCCECGCEFTSPFDVAVFFCLS